MLRRSICCALLLLSLAGCASTVTPNSRETEPPTVAAVPSVTVDGDIPRPSHFDAFTLAALTLQPVPWTHEDESHTFTGVSLFDVLAACGHASGPGGRDLAPHERRPGWGRVVIAWGADGHQAIFSCAELDPDLGASTKSYLVWEVDGGPLQAADGQFRLITPTDERGFRSVRQLVRLNVRDLREVPFSTKAGP
jgi:hypothetical protein